jgi:hypothetical protein
VAVLLANRRALAMVILGHALQQILEGRHAVIRIAREVGAAKKGLLIAGR